MPDENVRPNVDRVSGVPSCTETCPSHDGKRCRLLGFRPDRICEPAVIDMAVELGRARGDVQERFTFVRASDDSEWNILDDGIGIAWTKSRVQAQRIVDALKERP